MPPVMVRFVSSTLVPSIDSTEMLWSPSRVTRAVLPSGENATLDGPEVLLPRSTLPAAVTVFPEMVSTDTVPSPRFPTRARLPARFMPMPAGAEPSSSVAITAGGLALRSMTESRLSATSFFGSAGSSFWFDDTSAIDSSGVTATFCGGPTTLDGALTSPTTFGGEAERSMMVTVSSAGLSGTVLTPLTSTALLSFDDTASCAAAGTASSGNVARAAAKPAAREIRTLMNTLPNAPSLAEAAALIAAPAEHGLCGWLCRYARPFTVDRSATAGRTKLLTPFPVCALN